MTRDVSRAELKRAWTAFVRQAMYATRLPARLGRPDSPSYTFTVPGGHGFTYVRIWQGEGVTLAKAINRAGVALTDDLPIWVDKEPDGTWVIVGERYEGT